MNYDHWSWSRYVQRNASYFLVIVSANFKKVSQVASSSPIIQPSVEYINESVAHLVDTHPVLVLQWCQVLRQLKYMDSHFWCGFLDTGSRMSAGKKNASECLFVAYECKFCNSNPIQSVSIQTKPTQPAQCISPSLLQRHVVMFHWKVQQWTKM